MALYSVGARTTVTTASAPLFALRGDTARRVAIVEIGLSNVTAPTTSGGIGIVRSLTVGTSSAAVVAVPHDVGDSATTAQLDTAWSAAPTIAGTPVYLRRWHHGTAVGNAMVWTFDRLAPLVVQLGATAIGGSLVFHNLQATAAATYDVWVTFEVL